MSLTMLHDRIAVAPLEDPDKIGHIIIPEIAKQRIDQGIIIYKGPAVKELKIGWHVLFSGYAGSKISVEGEGIYYVMPEDAVAAVVVGSEDWVFTGRTFDKIVETLRKGVADGEWEIGVDVIVGASFKELRSRLRDHFFAEGLMF